MTVEIRDENVIDAVDCGVVRSDQLVRCGAVRAKLPDDLAVDLKDEDLAKLVVDDDQMAFRVDAEACGVRG